MRCLELDRTTQLPLSWAKRQEQKNLIIECYKLQVDKVRKEVYASKLGVVSRSCRRLAPLLGFVHEFDSWLLTTQSDVAGVWAETATLFLLSL